MVSRLDVGNVIAEKYKIERTLGVGGMGRVVAARHIHLDELVAIKCLAPDMLTDAMAVSRFAREARTAARIKNEHVVRVYDVGTLEDGAPYMVMEFLEGVDLAEWVRRHGPLPIEQAVDFVLQACQGLLQAHALGIVHRDLKPSNLFCARRNDHTHVIKLVDFGISKLTRPGVSDLSMTATATAIGSPLYMSPEQMRSAGRVDHRADIWALGVVLYELLTAKTPFPGSTLPEVSVRIATEPPVPLRALRPEIPPGIEAIILKCLEKDRELRYPDVAQLARALSEFGPPGAESVTRSQPSPALEVSESGSAPGREVSSSVPPHERLRIPSSPGSRTQGSWVRSAHPGALARRRLVFALVGVTALAAVIGLGSWLTSGSEDPVIAFSAGIPDGSAPEAAATVLAPRAPNALPARSAARGVPNSDPAVDARGPDAAAETATPTQPQAATPAADDPPPEPLTRAAKVHRPSSPPTAVRAKPPSTPSGGMRVPVAPPTTPARGSVYDERK